MIYFHINSYIDVDECDSVELVLFCLTGYHLANNSISRSDTN